MKKCRRAKKRTVFYFKKMKSCLPIKTINRIQVKSKGAFEIDLLLFWHLYSPRHTKHSSSTHLLQANLKRWWRWSCFGWDKEEKDNQKSGIRQKEREKKNSNTSSKKWNKFWLAKATCKGKFPILVQSKEFAAIKRPLDMSINFLLSFPKVFFF